MEARERGGWCERRGGCEMVVAGAATPERENRLQGSPPCAASPGLWSAAHPIQCPLAIRGRCFGGGKEARPCRAPGAGVRGRSLPATAARQQGPTRPQRGRRQPCVPPTRVARPRSGLGPSPARALGRRRGRTTSANAARGGGGRYRRPPRFFPRRPACTKIHARRPETYLCQRARRPNEPRDGSPVSSMGGQASQEGRMLLGRPRNALPTLGPRQRP